MITRTLTPILLVGYDNKKAIVVIGPRQVGKT
jgi:predicted AAA+ superfamily ATPase